MSESFMNDREPGKPKVFAKRYEVIRPLGRGGMGKVYLVLDRKTQEKRAIKLLRSQYTHNRRAIERFSREVQTVRKLDHPGIVKIFEARRYENTLFYVMEYLHGKSLHHFIQERKQLGLGSTVRILCLVARALQHAHEHTIHRDLSPDNIMVMPDGSIKILDFGLAKLLDNTAGLTMVGVNLGKIQYNAPEQRSNAAEVDLRADIYPLGIMFFEMLTGKRPQPGDSLLEKRPDLPVECEDFLNKTTAVNPEDRFQTAQAFHDALLALFERFEERKHAPVSPTPYPDLTPDGHVEWESAVAVKKPFRWRAFFRRLLGKQ